MVSQVVEVNCFYSPSGDFINQSVMELKLKCINTMIYLSFTSFCSEILRLNYAVMVKARGAAVPWSKSNTQSRVVTKLFSISENRSLSWKIKI